MRENIASGFGTNQDRDYDSGICQKSGLEFRNLARIGIRIPGFS
jgi:hypothetical protein